MQGKILIVDAIATNRIVLKVKLASAFYQVLQASCVAEALDILRKEEPNLVISALQLPDGSLPELCAAIAALPGGDLLPVMALDCSPDLDSRLAALTAGVHDVMTKPLDDALLLSRVRSLIRAHNATTEWQLRDDTSRALGFAEPAATLMAPGRITLVCENAPRAHNWLHQLRPLLSSQLRMSDPADAISHHTKTKTPDAFVLVLPDDPSAVAETLHLISALRANATTRHTGLLVIQLTPNGPLAANALDLGADDVVIGPFEPQELALRLDALLSRKRKADQMRNTVRVGLREAVFDPLTGLYNRRYAMPHLMRIADQATSKQQPYAVLLADMDHFKRINDAYGHSSGDAVLVEAADRLRSSSRGEDMVARFGGEEFLIIMPATTLSEAQSAARRLCANISDILFHIPGSITPIQATVSIGLAIGGKSDLDNAIPNESPEDVLNRADVALYAAKLKGRNRVNLSCPAA